MKQLSFILPDETATIAVGTRLAEQVRALQCPLVVYLHGDLGAGKTTLTRGFVTGMGHIGKVKSPTYTLVEPYELGDWQVYHFDLYRLADPEELEFMGIRDYFQPHCCSFIEWPEKGGGLLAHADLHINLSYAGAERQIILSAESETGEQILANY